MRKNDTIKILDNIQDPNQRMLIENILNAKYTHNIKCLSKSCKKRIIGHIDTNGKINPSTDAKGRMYMRAYRQRLDGFYGFECWCGNDSRLAEAEKGVPGFVNSQPEKKNIEQVWDRLKHKPASYPEKDGEQKIDNFLIEKI